MQKIYSLLRNNKQSGPYTLDELVALGLKPYDLIWAEGKTAGWCYPNEIDDLKSLLSISKETQQEKEAVTNTKEHNNSSEGNTSVAKHIYVSLPSKFTKTTDIEKKLVNDIPVPPSAFEELEESPEAKLERKAKELKERIEAFSEQKSLPKGDNELDVKYARSLDDIKAEYSSWLQDQKKKSISLKPLVYSSICIVILLLSFLGIRSIFKKEPSSTSQQSANKETLQNNSDYVAINTAGNKDDRADKKSVEKKSIPKEIIHSTNASTSNQHDDIDQYIDSLRKAERKTVATVLNTENREPDGELNKKVSVTNNPINPTVSNPPSEIDEQTTRKKQISENGAAASLDQLIMFSERSAGGERELTLHNNSSQALKFVAVDVFYYKANKSLLQKKTIYFHDINVGSSVSLPIPEYKKALSIQYHLGLISSEKGLYYAKQ